MKKNANLTPLKVAQRLFRKHGGILRTSQALVKGIHPRVLYAMRDSGAIEQISRGLFRLAKVRPLGSPDLVTVALKVPQGVVCLASALAFHELTTQVPREVSVALAKGAELPRLDFPPMKFHWISEPAFSEGIETHFKDGIPIRVYGLEKTIADCFKFRNRIGMDVCLEALRGWRRRKGRDAKKLMFFAKICRVDRIMRPYLEALA